VHGRTRPPSSLAMYDCDVFMRRATCACESPAAVRPSINVLGLLVVGAPAPASVKFIDLRHDFSSFIRRSANSTSPGRLLRLPALPFRRLSHSGPRMWRTCGSLTFGRPTDSISSAIRTSRARMSTGSAANSASTVAFSVSTVHATGAADRTASTALRSLTEARSGRRASRTGKPAGPAMTLDGVAPLPLPLPLSGPNVLGFGQMSPNTSTG
jgi:hypothetical protein